MCLIDWLTWANVVTFANSNFFTALFTALVGSAAGAFAGAYAAQRIVERGKIRDELLKEIRNTNAAIMLSFAICNSMLSLKKNHVKPLKDAFDASRKEMQKLLQATTIVGVAPFKFTADLRSLPISRQPTDDLQTQVFDNLSVVGRPLNLAATLTDVVGLLNGAIEKRNQLIEQFKATGAQNDRNFPAIYFGLAFATGHVNEDYATALDAINSYTDDAIYFSQLLCQDLNEHGNTLLAALKKRFRGSAPKVSKPDFTTPRQAGLIPADDNYKTWTSAFVKEESGA